MDLMERLRELAETASPGPWTASEEWPFRISDKDGWEIIVPMLRGGDLEEWDVPNANFVAASRTAIPELLDEIDRLTTALAAAEERERRRDATPDTGMAPMLEWKEFLAAERAAFAEYMKGWPEGESMDDYKNMQWLGWLERAKRAAIPADEMRAKMNDTIRQAPTASFDIADHTAVKTDEAGGYLHKERFTYER